MRTSTERGFTVIELVSVIVIVGVLAAIAAPRFVNLGTQARIAAVASARGAVAAAANMAMLKCRLVPGCAVDGPGELVAGPAGNLNHMYYGYPTGLTREVDQGAGQYFGIKDWVQLDGFSINESYSVTEFTKDGAPDPSNCKVTYTEVTPLIVSTTIGC